jgi:hypothetical protein
LNSGFKRGFGSGRLRYAEIYEEKHDRNFMPIGRACGPLDRQKIGEMDGGMCVLKYVKN